MDRMLLSAIVLWIITLSIFRVGASMVPAEPGPDPRSPAFFPHDTHMELVDDCKACHHRMENGENVVEEDELDGSDAMRCRTCHTESASLAAQEAFHNQCIGCHRTLEKEGNPTGPRTCGTCHPNKITSDLDALLIAR